MKSKIITLFAAAIVFGMFSMAMAEQPKSVHVVSQREETEQEITPGRMRSLMGARIIYVLYTVDAGSRLYQLEAGFRQELEVGNDYPLVKLTSQEMTLALQGKKKVVNERFYIKSISEKPSNSY